MESEHRQISPLELAALDADRVHKKAKDDLETAKKALNNSRGLTKLAARIVVGSARRAVEDSGQHLDLIEDVATHVQRPPELEHTAETETLIDPPE